MDNSAVKDQSTCPPYQAPAYSTQPGHFPPPSNQHWTHSVFDCFSPGDTCLIGCCFPCVMHGKTQARMKDPSLSNFSIFNGDCILWFCLSLAWSNWILQTARRTEMRRSYGIEGSCCGDCMAAFFCSCCTVIQEEKETVARTRVNRSGYVALDAMAYP